MMMMVHVWCLFVGCLCVCVAGQELELLNHACLFVGLFVPTTVCQKRATPIICCLTKGAFVKIQPREC